MQKGVAKTLLEVRSISFGLNKEFYSNQGVRLPIFCDNRKILDQPKLRKTLGKWIGNLIKQYYPNVEKIVGTAVAGISFAVLASEFLGLPMTYVWDSLDWNKDNFNEVCKPNTKVVIVDDVIYSGNTIINIKKKLKECNCDVLGAVAIFSYDFEETKSRLAQEGIDYHTLTDFDTLTLISMQTGKITYLEYLKLQKFKDNPNSSEWLK